MLALTHTAARAARQVQQLQNMKRKTQSSPSLSSPRLSQMIGLSVALDAFSESAGIATLNKVRLQSMGLLLLGEGLVSL